MRSLALVLVLIGCGDETVPSGPGKCTGKVYDSCNDEHDCTTMNCRPFGTIQVCTQACSDASPCPNDENGDAVPCTNMLCAPTAANSCTL